jgi:hypothetical protein
MKGLAGVDDSDAGFSTIDTSSEQHLRETIARAVRTRRGTIREFPDRYVDLAGYVQARADSVPGGAVAMAVQQDLEEDDRIQQATVTIGRPGDDGRVPFTIQVKTTAGAIVTVQDSL